MFPHVGITLFFMRAEYNAFVLRSYIMASVCVDEVGPTDGPKAGLVGRHAREIKYGAVDSGKSQLRV